MKSHCMLPESSRSNSRFGRMCEPPLVASGMLEMSVTPASAVWLAMQPSTPQSTRRSASDLLELMEFSPGTTWSTSHSLDPSSSECDFLHCGPENGGGLE